MTNPALLSILAQPVSPVAASCTLDVRFTFPTATAEIVVLMRPGALRCSLGAVTPVDGVILADVILDKPVPFADRMPFATWSFHALSLSPIIPLTLFLDQNPLDATPIDVGRLTAAMPWEGNILPAGTSPVYASLAIVLLDARLLR